MITINSVQAVSCKLRASYVGAWVAEVDLDSKTAPTGKVTIDIAGQTLVGTVNTRGTSAYGEKSHVTIEAGGGGWSKNVPALHFHNDAGVRLANVISVTAAEAGETVGTTSTEKLGADFTRTEGPASRIFGKSVWYVDDAGITQVKDRPAVKIPTESDVTAFNGIRYTVTISSADIVRPGMTVSDEKFGDLVVREVEQTFNGDGATAIAWCDRVGSETKKRNGLFEALASAAKEGARTHYLCPYRYRIVSQATDGRLILRAFSPKSGVPDSVAIAPWPGFQGLNGRLTPGSIVLVEFIEGDPSLPIVRSFATGEPIELWLSATVKAKIDAPQVVINGGTMGAARMGDAVQAGPWSGTIVAGSTTTRIG